MCARTARRRASISATSPRNFRFYGQLTVGENLDFFARAYGLAGDKMRERINWALSQFELAPFVSIDRTLPIELPQRVQPDRVLSLSSWANSRDHPAHR